MVGILILVLAVAFVFSMVGMGGGQVYTPAFYWMGMEVSTQAVPLALWLNFSTQVAAGVNYWRHGLVRVHAGLPIIGGLVVFAPLGALVSHRVPEEVILFIFATMTLAAVIQTLFGWKPKRPPYRQTELVVIGITVGAVVGFLSGMVGRGGGSLIVPVLLLLGLEARNAAATSSFAVAFSALAGFLGHLGSGSLEIPPVWLAVFTAAALVSGFAGSRVMARRLRSGAVKWIFAALLLAVAVRLYWDVFT